VGFEKLHGFLHRQGPGEIEPLEFGAAEPRHHGRFELRLDALGHDVHAQPAAERDHGLDDGLGGIDLGHAADE